MRGRFAFVVGALSMIGLGCQARRAHPMPAAAPSPSLPPLGSPLPSQVSFPTRAPVADADSKSEREISLSGVVRDQAGKPISGATVIVCNPSSPAWLTVLNWSFVGAAAAASHLKYVTSSDFHPGFQPVVAVTDSGGAWSLRHVNRYATLQATLLVIASGYASSVRDVVFGDDLQMKADTTLAPESRLRLLVTCGEAPCPRSGFSGQLDGRGGLQNVPDAFSIKATSDSPNPATFRSLPAGTYRFDAWQSLGEKGEARAAGTVSAVAGQDARLTLRLRATGTGQSISGHARDIASLIQQGGLGEVEATCGGGNVVRRARPDASGAYVLEDVGPGPCRVELRYRSRRDRNCSETKSTCELPRVVEGVSPGATGIDLMACARLNCFDRDNCGEW